MPEKKEKLVFKEPDVKKLKQLATDPRALAELEAFHESLKQFLKSVESASNTKQFIR